MFGGWFGGSNEVVIPELPTPESPADFDKVMTDARAKALELVAGAEGWAPVDTASYPADHGITLHSKSDGVSAIECVRASKLIHASPQAVWALVGSHELSVRQSFDKECLEFKVLRELDESTRVIQSLQNAPFPVSKRNLVFAFRTVRDEDGTLFSLSTSINYPGVAQDANCVRAVLFVACWIIKPVPGNENEAQVTRIVQVDVKGMIPAFVVNMSKAKVGLTLLAVENLLKK